MKKITRKDSLGMFRYLVELFASITDSIFPVLGEYFVRHMYITLSNIPATQFHLLDFSRTDLEALIVLHACRLSIKFSHGIVYIALYLLTDHRYSL